MIKYYIKSSLRFLKANKAISLINFIGLTAGIASSFILFKYIGFFYSLDNFQENRDRIYAIHQTLDNGSGSERYIKSTYNGLAPLAKEQYPEVKYMTRYITTAETLVKVESSNGESIKYNENHISEVDPDFLKMFTLQFISGDPSLALDAPNSMVLSSSMARKYFGDSEPVGQILTTTKSWGEKRDWTITGVIEDYQDNSYFQFDALQSLVGKDFEVEQQDWKYPFFKSFIFLEGGNSDLLAKNMGAYVNETETFKASEDEIAIHLIPLTEKTLADSQKLLIAVAIFLMLITWINYTNLSTTHSLTRGKEFGVKKVLGSSKALFAKQFLTEAVFIYLIAGMAALALIVIFYPYIHTAVNGRILPIFEFSSPINFLFIALVLFGSIVSATVPAASLSRFSVMNLIKNKLSGQSKIGGFRKILVTLQLIIALVMLTELTAIYLQMNYIQTKDLGIETKQTLILKGPKDVWDGKLARISTFKKEARKLTGIENVSSSTTVPLWNVGAPTVFKNTTYAKEYRMFLVGTDSHYFDGYDIEIVAGESYKRWQFDRKDQQVVINETAVRKMGFADPNDALNQQIVNTKNDAVFTIIGVVKDYYHHSLKTEIRPQVFNPNPFRGFISIHLDLQGNLNQNGIRTRIANIEKVWNDVYADQAFDYYFLDERFDNMYQEELLFQKMFIWFTSVSILITFLGIFGLSMFISLQRRKEMGIRKVMGASPIQVLKLFYLEFGKKVVMALLIGLPTAYYLINLWLSNFSYRFSLSAWIFILPALLITLFMFISLSYEGKKMVNLNPVKVLRDE